MASRNGQIFGNVFLPRDWTTRVYITETDGITVPTPAGVQILGTDPERLYFILAAENPSTAWYLWPSLQGAPVGISAPSGTNYVLIHHASYPGLVQGPWFLQDNAAGDRFRLIVARLPADGEVRDVY